MPSKPRKVGRPVSKDPRTELLKVRVTPTEKRRVARAAAQLEMTETDLVRARLADVLFAPG